MGQGSDQFPTPGSGERDVRSPPGLGALAKRAWPLRLPMLHEQKSILPARGARTPKLIYYLSVSWTRVD
jgi:hypothetical protein